MSKVSIGKLFWVCLLVGSCGLPMRTIRKEQEKGIIVYVLPGKVTDKLKEVLKGKSDAYFELRQRSDTCRVCLCPEIPYNSSIYMWIKKSNRKLLIGKNVYPVLLGVDGAFAIKESKSEMIKKIDDEIYPSYTHIMSPGEPYFVLFKLNGNIIKDGYY